MAPLLLHDLATASADVGATRSRRAKVARLADTISTATPDEVALVVAYLSGEPLQRRTGVGWASLQVVAPPAEAASVTVTELHDWLDRLAAVAGPGAKDRRRALLDSLLGRCTEEEQRFVTALLTGELRQGALAAMVVEGLAAAHGLPATDVRHAVMVQGAPGPVARALAVDGVAALATFTLEVGRPVQPMLASPASSLAAAMSAGGAVAVEEKLDGIRIQAHADRAVVTLFTRSLDDVTARLPEVVAAVTSLGLTSIVLDGEVLALTDDGRPRRFQETAGRTGSRVDVTAASRDIPLAVAFFDILHVQGDDLMGCPASERMERLAQFVPASLRVRRLVTSDLDEAESFAAQSLARGHEGVVVKDLSAPYEAGRRGASWRKVKPVHTVDLVVLAAEWGHGRRAGTLSNLHLGARAADADGFVMLGKTFKGLTDAMLAWQTERLGELATRAEPWGVVVRPELVVEIAFDGVQTSTRYPGGMALRFARVVRHRPDKTAGQVDSVETVRQIHVGPVRSTGP